MFSHYLLACFLFCIVYAKSITFIDYSKSLTVKSNSTLPVDAER